MSRKDKMTLRRGKILEVLGKYGSLSTDQLTKILNDKPYYFHVNRKTVERDIKELTKDGKVKPNPPIGREQTYSLSGKKLPVSEFFINQFWKELNEIRRLNVEDSVEAFLHLRSLIKTYPPLYQQLKLAIEKTAISLNKHIKNKVYGYYHIGSWIARGDPAVEDLIGRVASFLHKEYGKLKEDKEKLEV